MTKLAPATAPASLLKLLVALALPLAAGILGQFATIPAIPTWYAGLALPFFAPPVSWFGPIWSFLYALMGVAFWRILRAPAGATGKRAAIGWFLAQMALNVAWPFAFFGARSPAAGFLVILALLAAIVATIRAFRVVDRASGNALVPYLAWVGFAAVLNATIWWLNR